MSNTTLSVPFPNRSAVENVSIISKGDSQSANLIFCSHAVSGILL
ncbi:MAG: hypothetical protein RL660_1894 [Bacteroidota bacterium]|jgi:hypothetical protein